MRITVVQESDWLENLPLQTHHIMELLSLRGHDITVIHFPAAWNKFRVDKVFQIRSKTDVVNRIYANSKVKVVTPGFVHIRHLDRLTAQIPQMSAIISSVVNSDVVVLYSIPQNGLPTLLASRILSKPLVFHSLDVLHAMVNRRFYQSMTWWLESLIYRRASQVIAISPTLMEYMQYLGVDRERIQFLPPGVDTSKFSPTTQVKGVRSSFGIEEDDVVILYSGFLYAFSGVDIVVRSMSKLLEVQPRLKMLICGDGPLLGTLRELVNKSNLQSKVVLAGRLPFSMMPQVIAASDVCINPYQNDVRAYYSFPSKVMEYMASGKPIVMTKLPGFEQVFPHESGITLTEPGNFISALSSIVGDDALRKSAGFAARRFVEEKFSFEKIVLQMEGILYKACSRTLR